MKTKEILSILALVAIGLCLICGVAKTAMKSPKQKQSCDTACSLLVFVAVVLVGVSQLLDEGVGGGGQLCHTGGEPLKDPEVVAGPLLCPPREGLFHRRRLGPKASVDRGALGRAECGTEGRGDG